MENLDFYTPISSLFQTFLIWVRNCSSPGSCNTLSRVIWCYFGTCEFPLKEILFCLASSETQEKCIYWVANQEQNLAGKVTVLFYDCWWVTKSLDLFWPVFILPISHCPLEYLWSRILPLDLMILVVFPSMTILCFSVNIDADHVCDKGDLHAYFSYSVHVVSLWCWEMSTLQTLQWPLAEGKTVKDCLFFVVACFAVGCLSEIKSKQLF